MSEEQKFFYANAVEVTLTAYDVSLNFLRTGTPSGTAMAYANSTPATSTPQDNFTISMSPQHAKAMLPVLVELVKKYEEQFGTLPDTARLRAGISPKNVSH